MTRSTPTCSRRTYLVGGTLGALGLAGCSSPSARPGTNTTRTTTRTGTTPTTAPTTTPTTTTSSSVVVTESFDDGIPNWTTDSDVPADPNEPGQTVDWTVETSDQRASTGEQSLRFYLDGRQDDGTIWVVRPIPVTRGTAYDCTVSFTAYSGSESFNIIAYAVAALGPDPPTDEQSFPRPNTNSTDQDWAVGGLREPLNRAAGWEPYRFEWTSPVLETDTLYLAVGISAVWETEMTYFIDDVEATLRPRS